MADTAASPPSYLDSKGQIDPVALAKYLSSAFAPNSTGAQGLLGQLAASGGIYDPAQDLASVAEKTKLAGTLPTEADNAARAAGLQASGADFLLQQLQGVPVPQEGMLPQPNLPELALPNAPQSVRPQVNPLSQLLAIGAGFAAPGMAGGFNAAALEGQIQGAQEETARRDQDYKQQIAHRTMLYEASMTAAKERERVAEANRDAAFRNTVASTDRQLMLAKANSEQFTAHGAADSLQDFAKKYDPALKARDEVKALLDEIDTKGKASTERIKSVSELLTAVHKDDATGAGMAKDVFNQIMKSVQQSAEQKAAALRQQAHDQYTAAETTRREQLAQAASLKLEDMRQGGENSRFMFGEQGKDRRLQKSLSFSKPSESLEQSRQNQSRLQGQLGKLETALAEAESQLATARTGVKVNNMNADQIKHKIDSLIVNRNNAASALRQEQIRASLKDPRGGASGMFDPATGEVILR
jgi:hypothetical protein